ncbi:ModD protein [Acidithiobacillus sulfuriphilus]|uniref:ModD protein n=2 Tax=Acidithiobacillus sulfuriphilus TaxID=1867749 RepID=A0ACD5HNT7_9PROT|nr:ModD protein [Acidithiobacillus sulfuriphilus]RNF72668.1 ModD protein [Acidithiobacillus sulfuriphilus]
MHLSAAEIDALLQEDVPYGDLTTDLLGFGEKPGRILFRSRQPITVAGTLAVEQILDHLGITLEKSAREGSALEAEGLLLSAQGSAAKLHVLWRIAQNLLEYCSGIASKAARLTRQAQATRAGIAVTGTRKHFPGNRRLAVAAARAGGILPHRLGLSESVLVFDKHLAFLGGVAAFATHLRRYQDLTPGGKIIVELQKGPQLDDDALLLAAAGVDGLQFDKVAPMVLTPLVRRLREQNPRITLFAAGGIDEDNIAHYAATGVDAIVTSAVYHAPPADIGAEILPL